MPFPPDNLLEKLLLMGLILAVTSGCSRSPEDVEIWKETEREKEKMLEFATSSEEPMAVRQRAVELLVETNHPLALPKVFDQIEDKKAKTKLSEAAVTQIEKMWSEGDIPEPPDTDSKGDQKVKAPESSAVTAKDAAYVFLPYASSAQQAKLEQILDDWLSQDWHFRRQLGKTTLGQIIDRASDKSLEYLVDWMRESPKPADVVRIANDHGTQKIRDAVTEELKKRIEKAHPKLSASLKEAMLRTRSDVLVPYLEETILDEEAPPKLRSVCFDALIRNQGRKAVPFLLEIIESKQGKMRQVAFQRLIELRGKAAMVIGGKALPTDVDEYPDDSSSFRETVTFLCNFYGSEMNKQDVSSVDLPLQTALESSRWPLRVLGSFCLKHDEIRKRSENKEARQHLQNLDNDDRVIPGWGEHMTLDDLAEKILEQFE